MCDLPGWPGRGGITPDQLQVLSHLLERVTEPVTISQDAVPEWRNYECGDVAISLREDGQVCYSAFAIGGGCDAEDLAHVWPFLRILMHPEVQEWLNRHQIQS
jgi:hypothetical protein